MQAHLSPHLPGPQGLSLSTMLEISTTGPSRSRKERSENVTYKVISFLLLLVRI